MCVCMGGNSAIANKLSRYLLKPNNQLIMIRLMKPLPDMGDAAYAISVSSFWAQSDLWGRRH